MKISDFIMLNEEQKKVIVLHEGTLIAKRNNYEHFIFLFQMDNYYVETWCNFNNKKIEEYRIFDNVASLEPYLEAIVIDDILP